MQIENNSERVSAQENLFFPNPEPEFEITLERVIEHTRLLGNRIFASQVLVQVSPSAVFHCPQCGASVTDVITGDLNYCANIISRWNGAQLLANLVSEHECEARR